MIEEQRQSQSLTLPKHTNICLSLCVRVCEESSCSQCCCGVCICVLELGFVYVSMYRYELISILWLLCMYFAFFFVQCHHCEDILAA